MVFVLWIIVWLILNYIFWWFNFNTLLCFLVWIFLIMPVLLKIKFRDLKSVFTNKKLIWYNILLNFILLPALAFVIWYFTFWMDNYPYVFVLILLAIIPWWWLLMHRMAQTKSNLNIGFSLFAINLFLFSFVYVWYNFATDAYVHFHKTAIESKEKKQEKVKDLFNPTAFGNNAIVAEEPEKEEKTEELASCAIQDFSNKLNLHITWCDFADGWTLIYWFYWFIVLIVIPFIISRIILFSIRWEAIKKVIKLMSKISKVASFLLIVYIFSLTYIREAMLIDVSFIYKSVIAVILMYLSIFVLTQIALKIWKFEKDISKSIFWNIYTRFITLVLILSVLYSITWWDPWVILIPILAYFIQIGSASLYATFSKNGDSGESKPVN